MLRCVAQQHRQFRRVAAASLSRVTHQASQLRPSKMVSRGMAAPLLLAFDRSSPLRWASAVKLPAGARCSSSNTEAPAADAAEYALRARAFLQFLHDGVADMLESNPSMKVELAPADGADNGIGELRVFVSDEVGTYTFQPDVASQEFVMISPSSGCVRACLRACVCALVRT